MGLFAAKQLSAEQLIWYYYDLVVNSGISGHPHKYKTYRDGFQNVTVHNIENWDYQVANAVASWKGNLHKVWIFPDIRSAARYINNHCYIDGDIDRINEAKGENAIVKNVLSTSSGIHT